MNQQFLDGSINYLQQELGQGKLKYSPAQREKLIATLQSESPKALEDAFNYLILNHNGLPTPQKLIDAVRIEASKHRETDWEKEKREYKKPIVVDSEFARGCISIALQFFPGVKRQGLLEKPIPVNYENILSDAQTMAIKFPGSDWPNIFTEWREQWTAEGKLDPF